jgi:protein-tyrosine-phosphatase
LQLIVSEIQRLFGVYKEFQIFNKSEIKRLVFVCSGNICRSPLGECVAKSAGMHADSFGLDTRGGDGADPRAIEYAAQKAMDLTVHITKRLVDYKPKAGDLLIGMEPRHVYMLRKHFSKQLPVTLLGLWLEDPRAYLHDPYNTNPVFFYDTSLRIELATLNLIDHMKP